MYRKKSLVVTNFCATIFFSTNLVLVHFEFVNSLLGSGTIALDLAQLFLEILINLLSANKECVIIWQSAVLL
jgi:hypothetical protein